MGAHNCASLGNSSCKLDQFGIACLALFVPMLNLPSFASLRALCRSPQSLLLTPAFLLFAFLLIALLLITASITSYPPAKRRLPSSVLHLPFTPVTTEPLPCPTHTHRRPRRIAAAISRSASCRELRSSPPSSSSSPSPPTAASAFTRSSSHSSSLSQHSAPPPLAPPPLEDLSDEEANKTFSAFIQRRLALMKSEALMQGL